MTVRKFILNMQEQIATEIPSLNSGGCGVFAYLFTKYARIHQFNAEVLNYEEEDHYRVKFDKFIFDGYSLLNKELDEEPVLMHFTDVEEEAQDAGRWNHRFDRDYIQRLEEIIAEHFKLYIHEKQRPKGLLSRVFA